jgi:glucokinase
MCVGVDIGGTKTAAAWVDDDGRIGPVLEMPTRTESAEALMGSIVDLVGLVEGDLPSGRSLGAVGLGIAGLIDETGRRIRFSTHLPLFGHDTGAILEQRLGVPVVLENDATAAAWGEYVHGAGAGAAQLVMVSVGTGIGGGMVVDGRLYRGATGAAAEFGHVSCVPDGWPCPCGQRGCWEQYGSGRALGRFAREAAESDPAAAAVVLSHAGGHLDDVTGLHVTRAARDGDAFALAAVARLAEGLGLGLAGLIAALDPDRIVLGGGVVAGLGDLLIAPTIEQMTKRTMGLGYRPAPAVVPAALGAQAALIGAAASARVQSRAR